MTSIWNQYFLPDQLSDALDLLQRFGDRARIVAGGTDLVLDFSSGRCSSTEALIDISSIAGLKNISLEDGLVSIGSATSFTQLLQSDLLRHHVPVLTEATRTIAGPQIRNIATLGGNVVNASPAADAVPPLLALDTTVCIAGPGGKDREVPLGQFLIGNRRVDLRPGEIVTRFYFPVPSEGKRQYFRKVQPRRSMAIAILNLAILLEVVEGFFSDVRIAMGAVAPVAIRARSVEDALMHRSIQEASNRAVYSLIREDIAPITDFRASRSYRLRVAERLLHESITGLVARLESNHEAFV